ncbi:MAG: DNA-binding protein [Rubrivivax sp.]|nr:MAG: DNA-binding protein [Rubrivivax sp.]
MLNRLPKGMPTLHEMLADMARPSPDELAKALGVHKRTVYHWLRRGEAPRPVMLALFWVTRWGLQWADVEVFNLAQVHMQLNGGLTRRVEELKAEIAGLHQQIESLGRMGEFGSANDPVQGVTGPGPAIPVPVTVTEEVRMVEPVGDLPEPVVLTFNGFMKSMVKLAPASTPAPAPAPALVKQPNLGPKRTRPISSNSPHWGPVKPPLAQRRAAGRSSR